ncbi:MAG: TnsD family transposase [Myxacorys californica WJT36-NPBG1]|jgi:hypothetical protein|nr:TnsD family transposase [Myxacorys californica WJT36-NPBG1]
MYSQLSFFPKPYPDELLYSILARYHLRSGHTSPKLAMQELFDSRNVIATADLPCNLESLAAKLELISQMTVEKLIQNHTLYPFYAPFLPQDRSQQILEAMRSEKGGGIHNQVGIRASSIRVPKYFRFCPMCSSDDQAKYGELYWHRIHQAPGALVCPHHAEVLQDSSVPLQGMNRHEYIAAGIDNCCIHPPEKIFGQHALNVLKCLAQVAYFLLENELPSQDLNWFRKQYVSVLIERGLATATGRVHQGSLIKQFLSAYNQEILQALDSTVHGQDDQNWLFSIGRKHRKVFHPIRHLLMIRFLGLSVAELLGGDHGYKPFGVGPWLCLNAAAEHYLKSVVTDLSISLCGDTKKPVGTFSCSCGFIYCRTGPDQTEADACRIGKIKAVGPVWQQKLRQLVEVEQLGLRETAKQLQVDPRTVNRYVQRFELSPKWRSQTKMQESDSIELLCAQSGESDSLRTQHRNTWSILQTQYPHASKTALRRFAPSTYSWLYRYDREWLNQHSPPVQKSVYINNRVDWQQRDEQILAQVKEAVQGLLAEEKPIRITVSRVAKVIGQLALIEQHLDQMPMMQAYLNSVTESLEDYQIRRVRWAAKVLNQRGERVEPWKVVRLAGLKPDYSKNVASEIEIQIYEMYSDSLSVGEPN